ncbi:hypothetical protein FQN55_000227 [Onygenales sp. PD_40]|nr:hypothetical protein FQN55_000227 [Onygenales sp. PD_40]KAK2760072.1 hypothetical protein FQN53_008001 [Emmonsiellopsis sp. PD_33]KAK2792425.1 hypothetical protein FQN52_003360 [Onygenales sp. PD_12]KAK2799842.1 hypothetical protein FQN51_006443 [Onygenales sp. PD_10]
MPPKKAAATKGAAAATHASYKDMITDAIINLKERNGSSRQALKKYVQNNNRINVTSQSVFDAQFNRAVKSGVEKGAFTQPKGPSGPLKLAKKEAAAKPAAAKPAAKKAAAKPAAAKKEKAPAKKTATKAKTATKKAAAPKKAAAKPKANVAKPRKAPSAPAVVDAPKVLGKTKSGRVTKSTAKPAPKRATTTKRASKKATK